MSVTLSGIDVPRPNGLQEIITRFGDPFPFIDIAGKISVEWEQNILRLAKFPAPLPLSYNKDVTVTRFRHHRRIGHIVNVYEEIYKEGLWDKLPPFGGCYEFRAKRTSKGLVLSTHSWGIAVDHPLEEDQLIDERIIKVFTKYGFYHGRAFNDEMHFQYATGY